MEVGSNEINEWTCRGGFKSKMATWCKGNSQESISMNPAKTPNNSEYIA